MAKTGRSEPNIFGGYTHYDEKGHKIGRSEPDLFGGFTNYDAKGNKVGRSDPGVFGGLTHYDRDGHRTGRSDPNMFGGYTHRDRNGKPVGKSDPGMFGGYTHSDGGCYIATCVYGSYDCPEVRVLRRFRDGVLARRAAGRLAIRVYYAVSPTLVRLFGKRRWFRSFWLRRLDGMIRRLREKGFEDAPYEDIGY